MAGEALSSPEESTASLEAWPTAPDPGASDTPARRPADLQ